MYLTMHYHLKLYLIEISLTDLIFNLPQLNQSLIKLLLMQTEQLKLQFKKKCTYLSHFRRGLYNHYGKGFLNM